MTPPNGGDDDEPRDDPEPIDTRLLRTRDLIDLRLEAPNCRVEGGDGPNGAPAELVADANALLVLHFPPQHIGERAWDAETPGAPTPSFSAHRAAAASRLVFVVPEGTRIPFTLEGVLAALPGLVLRVPANATPAPDRGGPPPATGRPPEPPAPDETAVEAPYRLVVSPSERAAFRHAVRPVGPSGATDPEGPAGDPGPTDRAELWRTHLDVRPVEEGAEGAEPAPSDPAQRVVRAVWTRDFEHGELIDPAPLDPLSLNPRDRRALVNQTYGGEDASALTPLRVRQLALSSLGAWIDWAASWDDPGLTIADYRHLAVMGRDSYVRVSYPGFLFPFGHRCVLVKVTERKITKREAPVAYLWQRFFIIVRQPTRTYADRDNPFTQVTVGPLVTPDLNRPPETGEPFVPFRGSAAFPFSLTTTDREGRTSVYPAPLVFVSAMKHGRDTIIIQPAQVPLLYRFTMSATGPINQIQGRGQSLAMAAPVEAGDTAVEVNHLVFDGVLDAPNATSRPFLTAARAVVPAMRHLSPQAPAVDLAYAAPYLTAGLPTRAPGQPPAPGGGNPGELVLAITSAAPAVDFTTGSDRSGGFLAPNLAVRGLSRALGAVGETGAGAGGLTAGQFNPATFLQGALPKLFGLFSLLELLDAAGLDTAPAFVTEALAALDKVAAEARRLERAVDEAQARLAGDLAGAAHDGARGVVQQAKAELDNRSAQLHAAIDTVLPAVTALAGSPDGPHLVALQDALAGLTAQLQPLLDVLGLPGFPASVRAALTKPATALQGLATVADTLDKLLTGASVTARMEWTPVIHAWNLSDSVPNVFRPLDPAHALTLAVEVRASATAPPAVDIAAELVNFELNLIGDGDAGLMRLSFQRIGFHAGSSGKPEVDVVFGGIAFLGPLAFVDKLRSLIPFDGFSDPPYVDITPEGATAGFDLALPNVGIGVFSLENISLGADARIPFLGDAVTVGFYFCTKESPFRLTVMCIGGGGWVGLRASPKGLVLLEIGLEACASLSIDLGVASGSVSIAVGVYLRLEADKGLLTAYFRIRGEVDVLGLISASITLELSLTYDFVSGKLIGRASLVVEVEVLFFSASVEIVVERRLAGSKGDPTMYQVMPPDADGTNADWAEYCAAFAPVPAP